MNDDDWSQGRELGRHKCGTVLLHNRLMQTSPRYAQARAASDKFAMARRGTTLRGAEVTTIQIVVHVLYHTNAENISDAQIHSQIEVLNRDYRRVNPDRTKIPESFKSLAADARIEFVLAQTDPNGAPTSGITRRHTPMSKFSIRDGAKYEATGGADAWPSNRYLNLWVCPLGDGLLGYAQFPGGAAATDGVVIRTLSFGVLGTAEAPYNQWAHGHP